MYLGSDARLQYAQYCHLVLLLELSGTSSALKSK